MKIAYLVLTHKNPVQINHLIDKLSEDNDDIFLHVDLKSNIKNKIVKKKNVYILPENQSFSVSWGSNNIVLATLNLINLAQMQNKKYDYICLLSGQDLPIVSNKEIKKRLSQNKEYNYISVIGKNNKEYKKYLKLYELWYPKWITKDNTIIKIIKRIYMLITGGFKHTFKLFKRKKTFDLDFYFGSQWWCLTEKCAYYILDYCNRNNNYIKYFNNSIIPDECFFQTIFMNSSFKNKQKDNLTFINWKSNRRSPEILTIRDFELLKKESKNKCFARKFDENIDKYIIEKF